MSKEDIFTEMSERNRREANVIALNIHESDKAVGKDRLEDDRANLVAALPLNSSYADMDDIHRDVYVICTSLLAQQPTHSLSSSIDLLMETQISSLMLI